MLSNLSENNEAVTGIPNLVIIVWFSMGDFISNYHMWSWDVYRQTYRPPYKGALQASHTT